MSDRHSKRSSIAAPSLAALLLVLPFLYVGSYLVNVNPPGKLLLWSGQMDCYRWGGSRAAMIYWPLEQIDRRLRPHAWEPLYYY